MGPASPPGIKRAAPRNLPKSVGYWFAKPWVDWLLLALAAGICICISWRHGAWGLENLKPETRRALYQTLTTISGTLLGLTLTSISVLNSALRQSMSSVAARLVTPARKQAVARLFFAAVRGLAASLGVSLYALLSDSEAPTGRPLVQAVVLAVVVLSCLRIARTLWALSLIVSASSVAPMESSTPRPAITDDEY